ncbi:MAG: hypothetical protein WCJ64_07365 [Rhodospirillaceae bacterium]
MTTITTGTAFTTAESEPACLLAAYPGTADESVRVALVDSWTVQHRALLDSTPSTKAQAAAVLRAVLNPAIRLTDPAYLPALGRVADFLAAA